MYHLALFGHCYEPCFLQDLNGAPIRRRVHFGIVSQPSQNGIVPKRRGLELVAVRHVPEEVFPALAQLRSWLGVMRVVTASG